MPLPFPRDDVYHTQLREQRMQQQLAHLSCLLGIARGRMGSACGFALFWGIARIVLGVCGASDFLCGMAWGTALWNAVMVLVAQREARQTARNREALLAREED
jgi:hypothetical protein